MKNQVQDIIDATQKAPLQPFMPKAHYVQQRQQNRQAEFWGMRNYMSRQQFISDFGYVLVTEEVLAALVGLLKDKKVLDAGSGSGYLADALAKHGVDVTAADTEDYLAEGSHSYQFQKRFKLDYHGSALDLLPGEFDVVMLSWPCYESSFGFEVASAMKPGQMLVYQGEGYGGCTGDDALHDLLADEALWLSDEDRSNLLNENHMRFEGIHDRWNVHRRR